MTTEIARWQPRSLPEGWYVRAVAMNVDDRGYMHVQTFRVELEHVLGWTFEFEFYDPAQLDENGLSLVLDALSTSATGVSYASAHWYGR
jgi:hypothetical protein